MRTVCVTACTMGAVEAQDGVEKFDVADPGDILEFAEAWFERLSGLHKRAPPTIPEARALVQAAIQQLGAGHPEVRASLNVRPAMDALTLK